MKKVRIMLAAIVVLGSVGGALAFKAKTLSGERYCYNDNNAPGKCEFAATAGSTILAGNGTIYYTKTGTPGNCAEATNCSSRAAGFDEE